MMMENQDVFKNEDNTPDDERMTNILTEIANNAMECIKKETNMPSKNDDNELPILDMKIWTNESRYIIF